MNSPLRPARRSLIALCLLGPLLALILLPHLPATSLAASGPPTPLPIPFARDAGGPAAAALPDNTSPLPLARAGRLTGAVSLAPSAAPAPRRSAIDPTATVDPGHQHDACSGTDWHAPTDHEHGDPPPAWIMAAGYNVCFSGTFNTSPLENTAKHAAMKGFLFVNAAGTGQDLYFRIHAATNPGDRASQYHSYEWWIRGTDGKVSHAVGWFNTGIPAAHDPATNPHGARVDVTKYGDPGFRPVILTNSVAVNGSYCEQWYAQPGQADWMADFGWNVCGQTTWYRADETNNPDIYNPATWPATGNLGLQRRLEFSWYAWRSPLRGDFWTDQFGALLTGPLDPKVGTTAAKDGKSYTIVALKQHIEPTLKSIGFPGNAAQIVYSCPGCQLPN